MVGLELWKIIPSNWSTVCGLAKKIYQTTLSLVVYLWDSLTSETFKNEEERYRSEEEKEMREAWLLSLRSMKRVSDSRMPHMTTPGERQILSMDRHIMLEQLLVSTRPRLFWSTQHPEAPFVFYLVRINRWGEPLAGSNVCGFQALCRRRLAQEQKLGRSEALLNICRNVSLSDQALSQVVRMYLARRRYKQELSNLNHERCRLAISLQSTLRGRLQRERFRMARARGQIDTRPAHLRRRYTGLDVLASTVQSLPTAIVDVHRHTVDEYVTVRGYREIDVFPSLGQVMDTSCHCWDHIVDHTDLPRPILHHWLGRYLPSSVRRLVSFDDTWLLVHRFNGTNLVCKRVHDTFFLYEAKDCHLQTDHFAPLNIGHGLSERSVLRLIDEEVRVLLHRDTQGVQDLTSLVQDEHLHVKMHRAWVNPAPRSLGVYRHPHAGPAPREADELVETNGQVVTRQEKRELRRERVRAVKEALKRGERPQRQQLPIHLQNLTTQQYHEVCLREKEEMEEWLASRNLRSLPQAVKEFMKSRSGVEQWNTIHMTAVSAPQKAQHALQKLNVHLTSLGNPYPLVLNPNLVEAKRKVKEDYVRRQQAQQEAAAQRRSHSEVAQQAWRDSRRT